MHLTIVIPTYKRPAELKRLLHWLVAEYDQVRGLIRVVVSDNASPGGVSADVLSIIEANPWMLLFQQVHNVGPDQNFMNAVDHVTTPYFWLLGDDDLMVTGLLRPLLTYLDSHEPDLIYLPSHWTASDLTIPAKVLEKSQRQFSSVNAEQLAALCHVHLTFISSWIVKRIHWRPNESAYDPKALVQTNMLQMAWMLQALSHGHQFAVAQGACVIASSGNTGGYKLLTVFGKYLPEILVDRLSGKVVLLNAIMLRLGWTYLPSLIWFSRLRFGNNFVQEDCESALVLWHPTWAYRLLHKSMLTLPKPLAFGLFMFAKLLDRLWTLHNQLLNLGIYR
jgi:abequosyltransferase